MNDAYLKQLEQTYIDNADSDEYFAELLAGVSYEVDCMEETK